MAKSCILYPEVNGKPSRLYKNLLKIAKIPRPLTNYLYAAYITSDMADKMDAAGYKRNDQNQHSMRDVLSFIDFKKIQSQMADLPNAERMLGAVDSSGSRINYTNAKDALDKVDNFNDNNSGLVATVVAHSDPANGTVYNIIVNEKNANTHDYSIGVKQKLKVWDVYKQAFNSIGVDIENMPPEVTSVFSAFNTGIAQQLLNFNFMQVSDLYKNDALLLFSVSADTPQVKKLISAFDSLDSAAQFIDDVNHGVVAPTTQQKRLVVNAVNEAKKFKGLDVDALANQVNGMMQNIRTASPEENIRITLHKLNKKYKIGANEIIKINDEIDSLSDAATEALYAMERQLRSLQRQQGNNAQEKHLSSIVSNLMREINSKRYYSGIIQFLQEAGKNIGEINNLLNKIPQTGTELQKAFDTAKILQTVNNIRTQYYYIVSALANNNLIIDEAISQTDINNIRTKAKDLCNFFNDNQKVIHDLAKSNMVKLMEQIVGSETPDGQAIINAVRLAAADSSVFDRYLYSVGRASNPIVAAMGYIIRHAQDERNGVLNDISNRIRRATTKLYDAGSNSEFMYEDDGHIISDIDWKAYKDARKAEIKSLYAQGLRGFDLKQAINDWEEKNTEDRVVDNTNGRTERVPNDNYRKEFPILNSAQYEYYDTMMQIKGELGSLLPSFAQHQYLPPQVRRNMVDALAHAKSVSDVADAFKNKLQNLYTVREDDENYNMNGIIDGDEYNITEGGVDNTQLRQIPIFFINPLKDQNELLKNFSTALQHFAGTAINYNAMNSIVDTVEFMQNFVKGQYTRPDNPQADLIENSQIKVFKGLRKQGHNSNTEEMIDGFINQYVYGKYRDNSGGKAWNKLVDNIVRYTSFKGLATNVKGAFANYIMGEFQMLIEAGAGEFYNFKDYAWAHSRLFGSAGVTGEIWDLINETTNSKSQLFGNMFDPEQEFFDSKSHQAYHKSMFRKLLAHDLSFIGYGSGEYLIHYVNMYSVLHNQKVLLNKKVIPLYDAFEVVNKEDGAAELQLKAGVTRLDGSAITPEYIQQVKNKIKYVNQTTHGAMNKEDKGLIYQYWWGRMAMNFRQWMVEHYSRRFRSMHFDSALGENREGYWVSVYKLFENEESKSQEARLQGERVKAVGYWLSDILRFNVRARTNWKNLTEMQRANCRRAMSEFITWVALCGLSVALGEPDQHKKEFWRRWWIYQTRRMIMDTEASMPLPQILPQFITIMNSPFGGLDTMTSLLYLLFGFTNGDIHTTIKSGPHKGENKYWRNVTKYTIPFIKDIEQMQTMDTNDAVFKVFDINPTNR